MHQQGMGNGEGAPRPSLARLLDEEGVASRAEVEAALAEGAQTGERLGEVLLRRAVVDETQLARLLARQWSLPFLDEGQLDPDPRALSLLGRDQARELGAVPVGWQEGVPRVVVAEPSHERIADVGRRLGNEVRLAVVAGSALERLLARAEAAGAQAPTGANDDAAQSGPSLSILAELVGELDQGTAKVLAVRGRLEQLAADLLERDRALARSEAELAEARRATDESHDAIGQLQRQLDDLGRSREDDRRRLTGLREELDRRNGLLASLRAQVSEMAALLDRFGVE